MRDEYGAIVGIDWIHHLVHAGKVHRVNHLLQGVSASTGCNFIIDIPMGTELHWSASYFSKFGGILEASYNPVVTSLGTEIKAQNNKTDWPNKLLTRFYHTATATANPASAKYYVGIPGGTAVAGNGSSGGTSDRSELELKAGRWFIKINPYANDADVILDATVYEG